MSNSCYVDFVGIMVLTCDHTLSYNMIIAGHDVKHQFLNTGTYISETVL